MLELSLASSTHKDEAAQHGLCTGALKIDISQVIWPHKSRKSITARQCHSISSQQAQGGFHTDTVPCHALTAGQKGDNRHTCDHRKRKMGVRVM